MSKAVGRLAPFGVGPPSPEPSPCTLSGGGGGRQTGFSTERDHVGSAGSCWDFPPGSSTRSRALQDLSGPGFSISTQGNLRLIASDSPGFSCRILRISLSLLRKAPRNSHTIRRSPAEASTLCRPRRALSWTGWCRTAVQRTTGARYLPVRSGQILAELPLAAVLRNSWPLQKPPPAPPCDHLHASLTPLTLTSHPNMIHPTTPVIVVAMTVPMVPVLEAIMDIGYDVAN